METVTVEFNNQDLQMLQQIMHQALCYGGLGVFDAVGCIRQKLVAATAEVNRAAAMQTPAQANGRHREALGTA